MSEELKILADEVPTPTPTPGGEDPSYIDPGGKECLDSNYFCSVCETGFVDPVLRHTIVEASATLNDCQVCCTAREVREAVDAIQDLLDLTDSEYSMSGGGQSNPGSEDYEDVTEWSENSSNSDYSSASGTLTCNSGGKLSMSCGVGVRCSSGSSSCSVRLTRKNAGDSSFSVVGGTEVTENTSSTETTVIGFSYETTVEAGDQFIIQYKNEDGANPHEIIAGDSFWNVSISSGNVGTFSGSTITSNTDLKTALQELETAVEAIGGGGGIDYEDYELFSYDNGNVAIGATELDLTVFSIPALSLEEIRKRIRVLRNGIEMRLVNDVGTIINGQLTRVFSTSATKIFLHSTAPVDGWDEIEVYWRD